MEPDTGNTFGMGSSVKFYPLGRDTHNTAVERQGVVTFISKTKVRVTDLMSEIWINPDDITSVLRR